MVELKNTSFTSGFLSFDFVCCGCRSSRTVHLLQSQNSLQNAAGDDETNMSDSRTSLLNSVAEPDVVHVDTKQKKPSLLRALMYVVGPKLLQAHLCKLAADVLTFCGPLLQRFVCWPFVVSPL